MVGLKRGLAGAALGIGLLAAPGTAWAVASFSASFGVQPGFMPGAISGSAQITSTFSNGGQTIITEIELADSSFGPSAFLPPALGVGPVVSNVSTNTLPIGMPSVKIDYVGMAQDGGMIDSSGFATLTLDFVNTGTGAFSATLTVFPNLGGSASATEPGDYAQVEVGFYQQSPSGVGAVAGTVRSLATNSNGVFLLNGDPLLLPISIASAGGSQSVTLWFGAFGMAQSTEDPDTVIPVPAALPLLATALVGLGVAARRRRKAA